MAPIFANLTSSREESPRGRGNRARYVIIPRETLLVSRRILREARIVLERGGVYSAFKEHEAFMRQDGILTDNPAMMPPRQWPLVVKKYSNFNIQIKAFILAAKEWCAKLAQVLKLGVQVVGKQNFNYIPLYLSVIRYGCYERYITLGVELVFSSDKLEVDDKGLVTNREMITLLPIGLNLDTNMFWYSEANFERVDFLKRFLNFVRIARWMCESPAQRLLTKGTDDMSSDGTTVTQEKKSVVNGMTDTMSVTVNEITNSMLNPSSAADRKDRGTSSKNVLDSFWTPSSASSTPSEHPAAAINVLETIELFYTGTLRTPKETFTINISPDLVQGPESEVLAGAMVAWEWMNPNGKDNKVSLKGCVDLATKMVTKKEVMMPRV